MSFDVEDAGHRGVSLELSPALGSRGELKSATLEPAGIVSGFFQKAGKKLGRGLVNLGLNTAGAELTDLTSRVPGCARGNLP